MKEFVKDTNIYTVDALYYEPELAAIHLVRSADKIAIVDTGTQYSVKQVEQALTEMDLGFDQVELIILTHIHLDHAGGASSLMELCKNAQLIVHKKGARHMANPEKLVAGAKEVYGEEAFRSLYGVISSIDEARIMSPDEGEVIAMGDREFLFMDSPGHANHHHCILDKETNSVFTGDTLGISYQALRDPDHAFVMPTTTPVQFNPEALHQSIDKIMSLNPEYLYYTHYSAVKPNAQNIAGLHEQIDDYVMMTQQAASDESVNLETALSDELYQYSIRRAQNELSTVSLETIQHWVKLDSNLSAQGLAFWWQYRRAA
jgi:glyoxylase-like metal-dependent hydrolase (beta-lactamase superfamily II)